MKTKMHDVVIILPGIMGSVLYNRENKIIWGLPPQIIWSAATSFGKSLQQLELKEDDPDAEFAPDGVCAKGIMKIAHWAAPLRTWVDDYQKLSETLTDYFDVIPEKNYFEFAYDWRRDNRINARRLEEFVSKHLHAWRTDPRGNTEAKVILLGHSMGGLVARYYLEVLGGREHCKAFFAIATPHKGSVKSIESLANGKIIAGINLDAAVRSFPSIYQLLPTYKVIKIDNQYERIAEASIALPNIDKAKAVDALNFHHEIRDAPRDAASRECLISHIVGTKQHTEQSAILDNNGKIKISFDLPLGLSSEEAAVYKNGDGTVPRLSASEGLLHDILYSVERHGLIQNQDLVLYQICEKMKDLQTNPSRIQEVIAKNPIMDRRSLERIIAEKQVHQDPAAISLEVDDLYSAKEVVELRAKIIDSTADFGKLQAKITSAFDENIPTQQVEFQEQSGEWVLHLENLPPGVYRAEVDTEYQGAGAPSSVNGLFAVIDDVA